MKQTHIPLRLEFLTIGEELGWPRLPYGPGRVLRAGEQNWHAFARSNIQVLAPALRNAKTRRDNLKGVKESEEARLILYKDRERFGESAVAGEPQPAPELTVQQKRVLALAKARAAKAKKKEAVGAH